MSTNAFVSGSAPGAGRLIDMWMDVPGMVLFGGNLGSSNPTPAGLVRVGDNPTQKYATGAFTRVDVSNAITTAVYQGRTCMVMPDVGFNQQSYTCEFTVQPQAFHATGNKVDSDALNAWRVIWVVAASGFEAVGADVGMFFRGFLPIGGSTITGPAGNVPGFGVAWIDAFGVPNFVSRTNTVPGPPDEQIPIPGAVADGKWHAYEFRISWATDTTDASMELLYDNVSVITRSWAGATVLPSYTTFPGLGGLEVQIRKTGGVAVQNLYLNQFRVIGAPTFQSLF